MQNRLWKLVELNFRPDRLLHFETLFTIGNGYLSTRGAFEEGYDGENPTTLVQGIYNHAPGSPVPELVNLPNWLPIHISVDGTPFRLVTETNDVLLPPEGFALGYQRTLDLYRGLLCREILFRAASGSVVHLVFERFASLSDQHIVAQRVQITAVDGSPTIRIQSVLDGTIRNSAVRHWMPNMQVVADGDVISLAATTNQSGYRIGMTSQFISAYGLKSHRMGEQLRTVVQEFKLMSGETATFDKLTTIHNSRDTAQPLEASQQKLSEAASTGYESLLQAHEEEWANYWETSDIRIDGDEECQFALRFTTYHMLIAAPRA